MKKILGILFLGFLVCNISFADNPYGEGYYQKSNPYGEGYIQDSNPYGQGYYQED